MTQIPNPSAERVLHLSLKREYFEAIKSGEKLWEYRLQTDYWRKRLVGRHYDRVELSLGYPPAGDTERRISRPWQGYLCEIIAHPHFGEKPVSVYAIKVNGIPWPNMEKDRHEDDTDNWF